MGRLERHLDLDLIARMEAGNVFEPKPVKRQKPPRKADSYRGARRNEALRGAVRGVWSASIKTPTGATYHAPVRLNRSSNWPRIKRYEDGPGRRHIAVAAAE
jgi:hypothetical protein